jgi:hypothetical protein
MRDTNLTSLETLLKLFSITFPNTHFSLEYLTWLYTQNPNGSVIGFDMYDRRELVAHYACTPTNVNGRPGFLSLNTATHPKYRARGIFKILALETYKLVEAKGSFIVGVANQNSVGGFLRHLNFNKIGNLNLRYGPIMPPKVGSKIWTQEELQYRIKNPKIVSNIRSVSNNEFLFKSKIQGTPITLKTILRTSDKISNYRTSGFTLDWNEQKIRSLYLPEKLKPSPLVLILNDYSSSPISITNWNFADFDAY